METKLVAGVILFGVLSACGGGSSSSPSPAPAPQPTPAQRAVVVATASPNPVIVTVCTPDTCPAGYSWLGRSTVTIRESAGLGGNVDFVNLTLRNQTTGFELATLNYSADTVIARAGTNHVNPNASLDIPLGIVYNLAGGGRQATGTYAIQFTDDRGNRTNLTIVVPFV